MTAGRLAALLACALISAGCAISTDSTPRDIPEEARQDIGPPPIEAGEAVGESRIYLVGPADGSNGRRLRSVPRAVDGGSSEQGVLQELLRGPNEEERGAGIETVLPAAMTLDALPRFSPATPLVVETGPELSDLPGEVQVLALAQIVATVSELDGVQDVEIRIEGATTGDDEEPPAWPTGTGDLVTRPLTIYDYIPLLQLAQPDHPPVPAAVTE